MLCTTQYSKKMFNTMYKTVWPHITSNYPSNLSVIFRPLIQPWHPSSTLCHEAAVAVLLSHPDKFWPFSEALFEKQLDFYDVGVVHETRNQTYERLADIAATVGVEREGLLKMVHVADKPKDGSYNVGNEVTNDLKKMIRVSFSLVYMRKGACVLT